MSVVSNLTEPTAQAPPPAYNETNGQDEESSQQALHVLKEIRIPLYRWMVSLQQPTTGGYRMHHDGEVDVRASYTILCCAKLLQIDTPYLCQDSVVQFIQQCQLWTSISKF